MSESASFEMAETQSGCLRGSKMERDLLPGIGRWLLGDEVLNAPIQETEILPTVTELGRETHIPKERAPPRQALVISLISGL